MYVLNNFAPEWAVGTPQSCGHIILQPQASATHTHNTKTLQCSHNPL